MQHKKSKPTQLALSQQATKPYSNPERAAKRRAAREAIAIARNPDAPWGRKKDGTPKLKPGHRPGSPFKPKKHSPKWTRTPFHSDFPYQSKEWWIEYRAARREKINANIRKWNQENPDKSQLIKEKWRDANRSLVTMWANQRRTAKLSATPSWADAEKIKDIYRLADILSKQTGIKHTVDHMVPLKHERVCGLHLPINMQILSLSENSRKNNQLIQELAIAPTIANGLIRTKDRA